jgi:hypothetical protein
MPAIIVETVPGTDCEPQVIGQPYATKEEASAALAKMTPEPNTELRVVEG